MLSSYYGCLISVRFCSTYLVEGVYSLLTRFHMELKILQMNGQFKTARHFERLTEKEYIYDNWCH